MMPCVNELFSGLRAALFDLDGTLIETHIDFDLMRDEVARLARRFGLDHPPPPDILAGVAAIQERLSELAGPGFAREFRDQAFSMLQEIEVRQCGAPVEIEGAARLLEMLGERGIAVGIVTRNCRPVSEMLIERGRLKCSCLLTRDDVPRTKPDPGHLLAALSMLTDDGFTATPCLMVGDHVMDVQAGRAAGMRTVGILRGKPRSHFDACPPDLLVEGPADLLAFVPSPAAAMRSR
jgi:phosphoglycolate phosphatase